jgi:tight adherence protein C
MYDLILWLTVLCAFVLFTSITYWLIDRNITRRAFYKRLEMIRVDVVDAFGRRKTKSNEQAKQLLALLMKFSVSEDGGWENSEIRKRFMCAGYYRESDAVVFFGVKTLLTFIMPIIYLLVVFVWQGSSHFLGPLATALVLSALGYYLPDLWLTRKIARRRKEIFLALPNTLDLLRVCISAGLGLDAAIERVGKELGIESRALAGEFHILNVELRTGATREAALKELADRVGIEDIHALVAMLIQTEHFGTSVSEALRVYADSLRDKRALMAEAAAARIPVEMSLPLILCIFPALLVVLLGPAVIAIGKVILPVLHGVAK